MKTKLSFKDYMYIGTMLFGIMFGAGNLIFPISMGQSAGLAVVGATLGFLISAIGLPFLAIVAMGVSKVKDVQELATRVGRRYGNIFTITLYLVIGPLFALPRLASTSFTIGVLPFVGASNATWGLWLYSCCFFVICYILSLNPTKLLAYVGKVLTPAFLVVLGVLLLLTVVQPMGDVNQMAVQSAYQSNAFVQGILDGYNTLDVLAALAFGIVVISALNTLGVIEPKQVAAAMIKSGLVSVVLMAVIYWLLAMAGATSLGQFPISENGGVALSQIAAHYLGTGGSVLLALIIILGCLKTTVGLLTSFSETFEKIVPKWSYRKILFVVTVVSMCIANVGLTNIIAWAVPVLTFLYPIAIMLVLLALLESYFNRSRTVYGWTIGVTTVVAFLLTLFNVSASLPESLRSVIQWVMVYVPLTAVPFYQLGMGWIVPALMGLVMGLALAKYKQEF